MPDEPREELLDAAFRSLFRAAFPRNPSADRRCCSAGRTPARDRWALGPGAHALRRLGAQGPLHRLLVRQAAYDRTTAFAAPVRVQDVAGTRLLTSITNRATGVVLSAGLILLVYWLVAIASGPAAYRAARAMLSLAAAEGGLPASSRRVLLSLDRRHPPPGLGHRPRARARAVAAQRLARRYRQPAALHRPGLVGMARGRPCAVTKSSGRSRARERGLTAARPGMNRDLRSPLAGFWAWARPRRACTTGGCSASPPSRSCRLSSGSSSRCCRCRRSIMRRVVDAGWRRAGRRCC